MPKEELDLQEVKATGEDSETMDPVTPAGGNAKGKNRKADKNTTVDANADEIEDDVKTPQGQPAPDADGKPAGKKAPPRKADKAAVKESVDEMFEGQDLSEDFKTKAAVVFEAALNNKINEEVQQLEEEFETKLEEKAAEIHESITENVDTYMDYVVENWMKENELAIENGARAQVTESFMLGLKELFVEHNISISDEEMDVLANVQEELDSTKAKLDEKMNENIELNNLLEDYQKRDVLEELTEGLTETQAEKFKTLAEGVDFDDEESYKEKVAIIKENYFGKKKVITENNDYVDPIDEVEDEVEIDPMIARYSAHLSQSVRK